MVRAMLADTMVIPSSMALTLRTDSALEAALDALVEAEGVSRQEVIRRAVLDRAERRDARRSIDVVLDEELPRYAEAMERLGR